MEFMMEAAHIHNKVIFDSLNDFLQQFRPHGLEGPPKQWDKLRTRKLKPTEDFNTDEMFEIVKHEAFRCAIM